MSKNIIEDNQVDKGSKPQPRFILNKQFLAVQLLTAFFIIGLPVLTLVVSEMIVRETLSIPFWEWKTEFTKRFALNGAILLALFNILYILPRKWYMSSSLLLSAILIVFAFANKMKLELRNSPISIGDFSLLNELNGLDNPADLNMPLIIGSGLAFLAVIVAIFVVIPKVKEKWILKISVFLMSIAFMAILWTDYPFSPMKEAGMESTWWRLDVAMTRNGLFGNFTMLAKQSEIDPPLNYSKNTIEMLGSEYKPATKTSEEKPNVIFLMSEAFTDPYHFGEQHFIEDPIPNFHRLYEESLHGSMYSPEFGGGTANVEFEALTGLSRQFMPASYVAYQIYVKKPLPSTAYAFKAAGYDTTAIHSFFGWYYQRTSVYRLLGFNRFISGEFMNLDHENGTVAGFPKDNHITDSTIEALDRSKERDFIHVVSTEAHMPYEQLEESKFLKKGTLPDETRKYLNGYTEKMNSVDKELGRLVESLKNRDEPTILVFFGDHYPSFGNNEQVYGADGTNIANNRNGNYEDFLNTHDMPYFIWRSDGNESQDLDLSPNQLGAISLEMAGVQGNTITAILDKMRSQGDSVIPYNQWQKQMGTHTKEMKDLQLIQYDLLHGKRYSEVTIEGLIDTPSKNYHLGLYPTMEIQKVVDSSDTYEVLVKGAPKFTKLIEEDTEEIKSEWIYKGDGISSFTFNKKDIDLKKNYQFVLYDSLDNVLRKTKTVDFSRVE